VYRKFQMLELAPHTPRWIAENEDGTIWSFRSPTDDSCNWPTLHKRHEGPWCAFRPDNRYWEFRDLRRAAVWVIAVRA
jgi:hypothetical protein